MEDIGPALAEALFGQKAPEIVDWDALRREAQAQALELPALAVAEENGAPADVLALWRTHAQKILLHNTAIFREHAALTALLTDAGIACCTLKGVASASNYPDPFSRTMGDVDMLVSHADFENAKALLKQNGYEPEDNTKIRDELHHAKFRKNGLDIELHFAPCAFPQNDKRQATENALASILKDRVAYETDFGTVYIPCPRHNGLILLIHLQTHLTGSGVGLRHLCDWATFVSRTPDFPALMEKPLKEIGLWHFARLAAQAAERIGLPAQSWAQPHDPVADELFEEIAYAGNFGRKDAHYRTAMRMIPRDGDRQSGVIRRAWAHAVRATKLLWPFFAKCPVFLPVGLVMYFVRTLWRLLTRRTKVGNLQEDRLNADRRTALFQKLDLWKDEP